MKIKSISGDQPHESWGSWEEFLASCEVRDIFDAVTYYGKVNCNYIVFADGTLLQNYGYHGSAIMAEVRKRGATAVLEEVNQKGDNHVTTTRCNHARLGE